VEKRPQPNNPTLKKPNLTGYYQSLLQK